MYLENHRSSSLTPHHNDVLSPEQPETTFLIIIIDGIHSGPAQLFGGVYHAIVEPGHSPSMSSGFTDMGPV
jgi:hypothetical protein